MKSETLSLVKAFNCPSWATHIAVRKDGSKVEPAIWDEDSQSYLDEDPSTLRKGDWVGSYKECYWEFYSVSSVREARVRDYLERTREDFKRQLLEIDALFEEKGWSGGVACGPTKKVKD